MEAEDDGPSSQDGSSFEQNVVELTNAVRGQHGLPTLAANPALTAAARKQAKRCADAGRLSHTLGGSLGSRVKADNYRFRSVGENLSIRRPEANNVVNGWLHSPDHGRNMLNGRYRDTGVGVIWRGRVPYTCAIYGRQLEIAFEDEITMSSVSVEVGVDTTGGQEDE